MPDTIQCPFCSRKLQLPLEVQGQTVQCPGCGHRFVASLGTTEPVAAPDTAHAELYEHVSETQPAAIVAPLPSLSITEEPPPRDLEELPEVPIREAGCLADWQQVRQGVTWLYHGVVIGIVTSVSLMCLSCVYASRLGYGSPSTVIPTMLFELMLLGGLTSVTLQVVGQVMCLRSPVDQSGRIRAYISMPLLLLGLGVLLFGWILAMNEGDARLRVGVLAASLGLLILLVQQLFFLLHLRGIARTMRQLELGVSLRQLYLFLASIIVVFVLMWGTVFTFILATNSQNPSSLNYIIGLVIWFLVCALMMMFLLYVAWYVHVLSELRGAVTDHIRQRERHTR
ncbi:MAG: hypothetical protein JNM56_15530 [Planctomycetia bacterium]|nr:hypothetical protein [Planctomycetia bacterium]